MNAYFIRDKGVPMKRIVSTMIAMSILSIGHMASANPQCNQMYGKEIHANSNPTAVKVAQGSNLNGQVKSKKGIR